MHYPNKSANHPNRTVTPFAGGEYPLGGVTLGLDVTQTFSTPFGWISRPVTTTHNLHPLMRFALQELASPGSASPSVIEQ